MTDERCHAIAELLVQYSDGELPPADAARVAAHVAECAACRAELGLLQHSLELARDVWHEGADASRVPEVCPTRRVLAAASAAACVVLLAATAGYWLLSPDAPRNETARTDPRSPTQPVGDGEPDEVEVEEIDVEEIIAREARAARLAVAVELLASQPGLEEYHKRAGKYLAET